MNWVSGDPPALLLLNLKVKNHENQTEELKAAK